jgi:uncharacterized membrane protein (UPF0127 family)
LRQTTISTKPKIIDSAIKKVTINNKSFQIEVADTLEKQIQGLSDRKNISENSGMLFIYHNKSIRFFWMRQMNFPLDIIWIDGDTIVKINKNLLPEGNNPKNIYNSKFPVNYVFEINSGLSEKYNFKTGDKVKLQ